MLVVLAARAVLLCLLLLLRMLCFSFAGCLLAFPEGGHGALLGPLAEGILQRLRGPAQARLDRWLPGRERGLAWGQVDESVPPR